MMKIRRIGLAALMAASFPVYGQGLQSVETDQLRLLYFDPTETYLVPRVIQSYHGSMEVHERIFGYESAEKTTVLLVDFADYGNANATAVPSNLDMLQVSPIIPSFGRRGIPSMARSCRISDAK